MFRVINTRSENECVAAANFDRVLRHKNSRLGSRLRQRLACGDLGLRRSCLREPCLRKSCLRKSWLAARRRPGERRSTMDTQPRRLCAALLAAAATNLFARQSLEAARAYYGFGCSGGPLCGISKSVAACSQSCAIFKNVSRSWSLLASLAQATHSSAYSRYCLADAMPSPLWP